MDDLLNRVAATTSKTEIETHAMDENYDDNANTSLKQLRLNLDPGLTHIRSIASSNTSLLTICCLLCKELKEYSQVLTLDQMQQQQLETQFPELSLMNIVPRR